MALTGRLAVLWATVALFLILGGLGVRISVLLSFLSGCLPGLSL